MRQAALVSAALLAFSCSREVAFEPESPLQEESSVRTVHFKAGLVETKAQFGEPEDGAYPTLWTANDQAVKLSLNYRGAVAAGVNPTSDYRSATFDADIDFSGVTGPYTFYSVSPASAAQALSPSREAWKVTIPCVQTPTAGSVDEAGIILAATSASYPDAQSAEDVDLYFNHLTAYGRMSLTGLDLQEGETVSAVELTTTTPIVGDWYWKTAGSSITDYGASSTLTINTASISNIWFACAPVDVSGEIMTISVFTNLGVFEHMIQFPENRRFEAGRTAVFSVDMTDAEFVAAAGSGTPTGDFTLVEDASSLSAGDEIIITNVDATYALGPASTGSTPFRQAVNVSATGKVLDNIGTATVLTLRAGSVSGTWAMDTGDGYLTTTSSKNSLGVSSSISDESSWSFSIVSGQAEINAQEGTYSHLRYNYNQGTPRFSAYGASSNLPSPAVYSRSASALPISVDPMLSRSEYGCYLGLGLERSLVPGTDQVTRAYNSYQVLTYTIINPETTEELEISGYAKGLVKGDNCLITVNWRIASSSVLSESYTMKVVKEEGPKVWLSDGTGKGFIIKK